MLDAGFQISDARSPVRLGRRVVWQNQDHPCDLWVSERGRQEHEVHTFRNGTDGEWRTSRERDKMTVNSIGFVTGVVMLGLVIGCAPQAPPDTPELRLEKAQALAALEVGDGGGYEETLALGADWAADSTRTALMLELGRDLTDAELQQVEGVMHDALSKVLSSEEWVAAAAAIYAEHFTSAELDAALEFYSSPAGARILEMQSSLDRQMGDAVDAIVEARLVELIDLVDQGLAATFPELVEEEE